MQCPVPPRARTATAAVAGFTAGLVLLVVVAKRLLEAADPEFDAPTEEAEQDDAEEDHTINVRPSTKLDGSGLYMSFCSCGTYFSAPRASEQSALRDGEQHVRAKRALRPVKAV